MQSQKEPCAKNSQGRGHLDPFRLTLFIMAISLNALLYLADIKYGWLIFLSNILLFNMSSDTKTRLMTVTFGALSGLVLTYLLFMGISVLGPILGGFAGLMLPLAVILFVIIMLQSYAPLLLNHVTFIYLSCLCISPADFAENTLQFFLTFIIGSLIYNGICLYALKWITARKTS